MVKRKKSQTERPPDIAGLSESVYPTLKDIEEQPVSGPNEKNPQTQANERPMGVPQEQIDAGPIDVGGKICGIDGCRTYYADPLLMAKHKERQHGIGIKNLNQPNPRNKDIKLA